MHPETRAGVPSWGHALLSMSVPPVADVATGPGSVRRLQKVLHGYKMKATALVAGQGPPEGPSSSSGT